MAPTDLIPYGALGIYAWVLYRFHRSAISAHEKRADEWNEAYKAAATRADVRDAQLGHVISAVPKAASNIVEAP